MAAEETGQLRLPVDPEPSAVVSYVNTDPAMRAAVARAGEITDALRAAALRQQRYVALVSWSGRTLDGVALLTRERVVATNRVRVLVRDFRECPAIPFDRLLHGLPASARTRMRAGGELAPDVAAAVHATVRRVDRELADAWDDLARTVRSPVAAAWTIDGEPIVAYEREATGIALEIAGFDRRRHLERWGGDRSVAFLADLGGVRVLEQALIAADARVFGDWSVAEDRVSAVEFAEGERRLTVINANQTSIEQTLGCDLVYYTREYDSYVLVQYKRLTRGRRGWEFRPSRDRGFDAQLDRLRTIAVGEQGAHPNAWRLGRTCCFVKLCEPVVRESMTGALARGLYLPLEYIDGLRAARAVVGPRGGEVFSEETVGRWLNNGAFVELVQRSWLGTHGIASERIAPVIRDALAERRSVTLAIGDARRAGGARQP